METLPEPVAPPTVAENPRPAATPTVADGTRPVTPSPAAALPAVPGYEVLELVGRGGMGRVYRAKHLALGRVVAIKLMANEPDDRLLARFREEARAVARLQHPNIAQLYETGLADGRPYYAQEFVEGGSLAQAVAGRPQDPAAAARLVEAVARAVQFSHENGILHRDLKPANILCLVEGRNVESRNAGNQPRSDAGRYDVTTLRLEDVIPKVTDFGLAKAFAPEPAGGTKVESGGALTRTGEVLGTPAYMPPEQASGVVSAVGPAADVYGLGAILYELLTGRPPFQAPDPLQTMLLVLSMDPVPPRTLQPKVPKDLETICLKCLEKSPKKRYAAAKDLADDLRRFLHGEPILARPVGVFERAAKWARRSPWKAVAAGLAVAGVLGLVGGLLILAEKNRQVRDANAGLANTVAELEQANTKLTAAKAEAEDTLGLALAALNRYFFEFSDALKDTPKGQALRLEVLDQAGRVLDKLGDFRPGDVTIRNYQMTGYDRLGNAEAAVGRADRAESAYRRAKAVSAGLAAEFPDDPLYRRNVAIGALKLAAVAEQTGRTAEVAALYAEAQALGEALVKAHPDDVAAVEFAGRVQLTRYGRALAAKDNAAAERELRALVDTYRRLVALDPQNPDREVNRIDGEVMLAGFLITARKLDAAEPLVTAAVAALDKVTHPNPVRLRKLRASVRSTLGMLRDNQNRPAEAAVEYAAVLAEARALAADFPDNPQYRYEVGTNLWWLGHVALAAGKPADARRHWQEARGVFAALADRFPAEVRYRQHLVMTDEDLGQLKSPAKTPDKKP